jgi:NAD(P)-dependent dehydrogenase (short-subunit alcohol dehydrogenase family)
MTALPGTALSDTTLSGITVGSADAMTAVLAAGLSRLGAAVAHGDAAVDVMLVGLTGAPTLQDAAGGRLADVLTAGFAAAREAERRLRPASCLLLVLEGVGDAADTPDTAAVAALTRTLALEWATEGRRVNALLTGQAQDATEAAALIAWRPSRMLTGVVLDARTVPPPCATPAEGPAPPATS